MSDNEIIDALRDSLLGYDVLTSDEIEIKLGKISDKIITQSSDLARLRELLGEVRDRVLVFGLYSPDLQSRIQSELKE